MGSVAHRGAQIDGANSPRRRGCVLAARAGLAVGTAALGAFVGGCQVDSFLDPSITGRWEHTPTSMPILDRISVIEDDLGDSVEMSDVTPDDLIAESREYRIAPGDRLTITLYDFEDKAQGETELPRDVDLQGNVDIPQLGLVNVAGKTVQEAQDELVRAMSKLVIEPLVAVVPVAQRQQTFSVVGSVETPGPYFIPRPDYRLLEAITASGRFPETIDEIYVIRQIPLDDALKSGRKPAAAPTEDQTQTTNPGQGDATPTKPADNLVDLINELSKPGDAAGQEKNAPQEASKQIPPDEQKKTEPTPEPKAEPKEAEPPVPLPEPKRSSPSLLAAPISLDGQPTQTAQPEPRAGEKGQEPAVDLVAPQSDSQTTANTPANPSEPTWVFVNGEWVMVKPQQKPANAGGGASPQGANAADQGIAAMVTQRVIRIPVKALLSGDARYNIVVRQGDTIRVPAPLAGLVYMTGQVQRPGPYSLPDVGKLTLLRAIDSAGGLSAIAIPERCDITRIVGKDRQATIMLNLRSISEQTEPDLYLKPDDRINIGTNFWALPLAVIRGGFRTNYGFGFVVDRNFGNDIFGPPPENRGF